MIKIIVPPTRNPTLNLTDNKNKHKNAFAEATIPYSFATTSFDLFMRNIANAMLYQVNSQASLLYQKTHIWS